jgi:hypothetical protein
MTAKVIRFPKPIKHPLSKSDRKVRKVAKKFSQACQKHHLDDREIGFAIISLMRDFLRDQPRSQALYLLGVCNAFVGESLYAQMKAQDDEEDEPA